VILIAVSERNIEIIRKGFNALNRGDIDALLELCHPDIELLPSIVGGVEGTSYRGRDGYRRWFEEQAETYDHVSFEPQDIRAVGDQVVALYITRVRGAQSGVELRSDRAAVFTIREGCVLRQVGYQRQADALRAVGLDG
jgi:ketosteroid isomerase-like protein